MSNTSYFPDGKPVPELLTEEEAVKFLRLDEDGPRHPEMTLQYYRQQGLLKAVKVGKKLRYLKSELLKFLEKTDKFDKWKYLIIFLELEKLQR